MHLYFKKMFIISFTVVCAVVLLILLVRTKITPYVIRHCNGFFFNKFFINDDPSEITDIIASCKSIYEDSKRSEEPSALILTFEQSHFFNYYKIQDAGGYNVFIGPVYTREVSKKDKIKPFVCYSKNTDNMGIADLKDRIFYLKLLKDQKDV